MGLSPLKMTRLEVPMVGIERISELSTSTIQIFTPGTLKSIILKASWVDGKQFQGKCLLLGDAGRESTKKKIEKKNGDELWPNTTKLHQVYVKHWVDLCLTSGSLRLMKDPCWFSLDKCWRLASWRMLPTVTSEWTTKTLHHVGTWISLLNSCHLGVIIPVAPVIKL